MPLTTITRTDGDDTFLAWQSGISDDLILEGLGGNDVLAGGNGRDQVFGGAGNDTITSHGDGDALHGEDGNDLLIARKGDTDVAMFGGKGDDIYEIGIAWDIILHDIKYFYGTPQENAGEGRDGVRLRAFSGMDYQLPENIENLTLIQVRFVDGLTPYIDNTNGSQVHPGFDGITLRGNGLDNVVTGSDGDDTILGGAGHDTLKGGVGDDRLEGGAGNDSLDGGSGVDLMIGGSGDDTYVVNSVLDQVVEVAGGGTDRVLTLLNLQVLGAEIENLGFIGSGDFSGLGNGKSNAMAGGAWADTLTGLGGNDTLDGKGGADSLAGGQGNDSLIGGAGYDTLTGDAGSDTLKGGDGRDLLSGGDGADLLLGGADGDSLAGGGADDTLRGEAGSDTLSGGSGRDSLDGGSDNDRLYGDAGQDTLAGGGGNDLLEGGADNDLLWGGDGADTLKGGAGDDGLTGGAGTDLYVFAELGLGDWIGGFEHGIDRIDLSAIDAHPALAGDQAFAFHASKPASVTPGTLWLDVVGNNTFVRADLDGGGTAELQIAVYGVTNLTAADFIL
jgi:Ca2+-binding RTX toxin-like protein